MLKETYLDNCKNLSNDAYTILVTRYFDGRRYGSYQENNIKERCIELSPSKKLLEKYKKNKITFKQLEQRYIIEMNNPDAKKEMQRIKELSKTIDVYLVCYEKDSKQCHRSILLKLIKNEI